MKGDNKKKMITPFMPTLNLSVDNALSLQQIVHQLITEINNIVEYINNGDDKTDDKIKVALSEYDTRLQKQLESIEDRLQSEIVKAKENCKNYTDLKASEIYNEIDKVVNELDAKIIDVDEKTDAYYDVLVSEIDLLKDEISKIETLTTTAVSPLDGMSKSISDVVYDLNQQVASTNSITIGQICRLLLSDDTMSNPEPGTTKPAITTIGAFLSIQKEKVEAKNIITFFNQADLWSTVKTNVKQLCYKSTSAVLAMGKKGVDTTGDFAIKPLSYYINGIFDLNYIGTTYLQNWQAFNDLEPDTTLLSLAKDLGLLNDDYTIKESGVYPL